MAIVDSRDVYERVWKKCKAAAIQSEKERMDVVLAWAFEATIEAEQPNKKPR